MRRLVQSRFISAATTGPKSKGIYLIRLDPATGQLSTPEVAGEVANPSFLWIHPTRKFLYAAGETNDFQGKKAGAVSAFSIDPSTLKLTMLNQQSAGGGGTCFVSVDHTGKTALVANYGGGSFESLPIGEDGKLGEPATFIQDPGAGTKTSPHGHSIFTTPDNKYAIASDLGLDQLAVYKLDPATAKLTPNDPPSVSTEKHFGPRHFAFHPNGKILYSIGEYGLQIATFAYDGDKGTLTPLDIVSTVVEGTKKAGNSCAEVVVHPSGKFVYGSNRGPDDIAIFSVDAQTGKLTPAGRVSSGGKTPRNIAIDPSGQFLVAANQNTGNIVAFKIDQTTGALTPTGGTAEVSGAVLRAVFTRPVDKAGREVGLTNLKQPRGRHR